MSPVISSFRGGYRFLSNFYPVEIEMEGMTYPTVEHAFQAMKTRDPILREMIRKSPSPGIAKRAGRRLPLRHDWDEVKLVIMLDLLRQKFHRPELADQLLATGKTRLVEGNNWHDAYWGVCEGTGQNHLGKLLMKVREELRSECV